MSKKSNKWVLLMRWVARIWSLGPIFFALAHIFFPDTESGAEVATIEWFMLGMLGIAVVGLAIGWRWEQVGGWISMAAMGIVTVPFMITVERSIPTIFILWGSIGLPAILYLLSAKLDQKN